MKKILLFLFGILFFCSSCNAASPMARSFKKVKVGMDVEDVEKIMGKENDVDSGTLIEYNYYIYYWFEGAASIQEAESLSKEGTYVKYYAVLFYYDNNTLTIKQKADIIYGFWGQSTK